jgi:hypothetical protein
VKGGSLGDMGVGRFSDNDIRMRRIAAVAVWQNDLSIVGGRSTMYQKLNNVVKTLASTMGGCRSKLTSINTEYS